MIFADPPYFLSNGGISVQSGKVVCVDKGEWDKGKEGERLLGRMLALRFFPSCDGRQAPDIRHLLVVIQPFHQLVVVIMRHLLLLSCPDNELGGVSKVSARDIRRRIRLSPRNDIQDFESQLRQLVLLRRVQLSTVSNNPLAFRICRPVPQIMICITVLILYFIRYHLQFP